MGGNNNQKLADRNIPGMNRNQRFAEVQHADDVGAALKRIAAYFAHEKIMLICMLAIVVFGTLCGIYAPGLQSNVIDIIAGTREGSLTYTLIFMLIVYLLYSGSQLLQGFFSARLSQRIVRRMREELFGKIVELPVRYLDTHSHGDVMSRMTNDIENISTTVSQSLPSFGYTHDHWYSSDYAVVLLAACTVKLCNRSSDTAGNQNSFGECTQVFTQTSDAAWTA